MRERESKFIMDPGRQLPRPAELLRGMGRASVDEVDQVAVYFDTADLRLTRGGASLRYRSDDGWTVKLPEATGSMIVREELSFAGADAHEPPEEALGLVRAFARLEPVRPVAKVRTHRRRIQVRDRHDRPVGEIDDDVVEGSADRSGAVRFHEVEFEVAEEADPKSVARVVKRLRAAGAQPDRNRTKISRVLGESAEAPPDVAPAEALDRHARVDDLARLCLTNGVARLVAHDPVVRCGKDPEGVHQARVATRRLRSDLRTLRPVLDRAWSEPLRDELRWIGGLLGRVRDGDVLAELVAEHANRLRPGQHARAITLVREIEDQRAHDQEILLEAMNSPRYAALLDRLVEGARAPRLRTDLHGGSARLDRAAARLVRKPWKRLRDQIRRLPATPADSDLHEVRKRAKQVRYALEAVAPVLGKPAQRAAKRLAALQDTLGDHQDAVVAAESIEGTALRSDDVVTAFVAGEMTQTFASDRQQLREDWPDQWERSRREYRHAIGAGVHRDR
jgi:CHAD domain-containing protein